MPKTFSENDSNTLISSYFRFRIHTKISIISKKRFPQKLKTTISKKSIQKDNLPPNNFSKIDQNDISQALIAKAFDYTLQYNRQNFSCLHPQQFLKSHKFSENMIEKVLQAIKSSDLTHFNNKKEELVKPSNNRYKETNPKTPQDDTNKFKIESTEQRENWLQNFHLWKVENGIKPDSKIFHVENCYPQLKTELINRDWAENKDVENEFFDFKFTIKQSDINYNALKKHQIINQIVGLQTLSAKIYLNRSLQGLIYQSLEDTATFFPRCYDLNCFEDHFNFLEDFKLTNSVCFLKNKANWIRNNSQKIVLSVDCLLNYFLLQSKNLLFDFDSLMEAKEMEMMMMDNNHHHKNEIESIEEKNNKITNIFQNLIQKIKHIFNNESKNFDNNCFSDEISSILKNFINQLENDENDENEEKTLKTISQFVDILLLSNFFTHPQFSLNGLENLWIVKPSAMSRGRGIIITKDIIELECFIFSSDTEWIIQKYIEKPLIIHNRKVFLKV